MEIGDYLSPQEKLIKHVIKAFIEKEEISFNFTTPLRNKKRMKEEFKH